MAARGAVHQISPPGADSPAAEGVSDTPQSRFSDEGDSILAGIPETYVLGTPRDSQRLVPSAGTTRNTEGRNLPATDSNQDDDAQSSVSGTTAVETGLRVDPGSRAQARARDLEDEISRFCADPRNPITPSLCGANSWRRAGRSRACRGESWWRRDRRLGMFWLVRLAFIDWVGSSLADPGGPAVVGVGGGLAACLGAAGGMSYAATLGSGALPGTPGAARTGLPGPQAAETSYAASWIDVTLAAPSAVTAGYKWEVREEVTYFEHRNIEVRIGDEESQARKRLTGSAQAELNRALGREAWFDRVVGAELRSPAALACVLEGFHRVATRYGDVVIRPG
ncbi:hypothetical protein MTO96_038253 [Rhipicephalus appendiculatus]